MHTKTFLYVHGAAKEKNRNDLAELDFTLLPDVNQSAQPDDVSGIYLDRPGDESAIRERLIAAFSANKGDPALLLLYGEEIPFGFADMIQDKLSRSTVEVVRMAILHGKERVLLGGASTGEWVGRLRRHLAAHRMISLVCRPIEVDEALRLVPAFLDWKSQFYLRMGEQCDQSRARLEVVGQALGMDKRIGQGWLPEEVSFSQLQAGMEAWLRQECRNLKQKTKITRIAFWGGESQLEAVQSIISEQTEIRLYDPYLSVNTNEPWPLIETLDQADLLVIGRANQTVRELGLQELVLRMKRPLVIDVCSCYPLAEAEALQIRYRTFGQNTNVWEWNGL